MANHTPQEGGCLCGAVRYRVTEPPIRVSFCHCRFCQRATGGPYAVEPIFNEDAFELLAGTPTVYTHVSEGSGKEIDVHFCGTCGSGIRYGLKRFDGLTGLHGGSFDDPNWFDWTPETAKHIFLDSARPETLVPAGLPLFMQHAMTQDGKPVEPIVLDAPKPVSDLR